MNTSTYTDYFVVKTDVIPIKHIWHLNSIYVLDILLTTYISYTK